MRPSSSIAFILAGFTVLSCGGMSSRTPVILAQQARSNPEIGMYPLQHFWTHLAVGEGVLETTGIPGQPETALIRIRWRQGKTWWGDTPIEPTRHGESPHRWSEWLALVTPPGMFKQLETSRARWEGPDLVVESSPRLRATVVGMMPVHIRLEGTRQPVVGRMLTWKDVSWPGLRV